MSARSGLLLSLLAALGAAVVACAPAESQTLRERLRDRIEQRRAERQGAGQEAGAPQQANGLRTMTLTSDGVERTFYVYEPAGYVQGGPAVLVYHGGLDPENVIRFSGMNAAADRLGFLAVYPRAAGEGLWNDGRASTAENPNDVAFTRAMISDLADAYGIDTRRVFATGMSNGGIFLQKLACDAPDLVAAVAPVSGLMPETLRPRCAPRAGIPMMLFAGTDDPMVPFAGGTPERADLLRRTRGPIVDDYLSAPDTARFWANIDGCGAPVTSDLADTSNDGTSVRQIAFEGCRSGEVILVEIDGGGHTWPGAEGRNTRLVGRISHDVNATSTMLGFFSRYGL